MIFALLPLFCILEVSECVSGVIWSWQNQSFIPIFSIPTFSRAKKERMEKLRELEYHNFQNEVLSVAYFQELRDMVNFMDNDTRISGVYGEVWNMLADYLNFTLVPLKVEDRIFGSRLENGSYDGLIGLLQRNQTQVIPRSGMFANRMSLVEYTMPLWKIRYHFYIKPEWSHDGAWMLRMFSPNVWAYYHGLLFVLGVAGYIYEKNSEKMKKKGDKTHTLQDYIFYTIAIASSQGSVPTELQYKSRLTYITTSLLSWFVLIAFNSHAIFLMMNKRYIPPFTGLKSLIQETDYDVIAFSGSMVHELFRERISKHHKYRRDRYRVSFVAGTEEMFTKVCFSKKRKFAAFEAEDRRRAVGKYICQLTTTRNSYFATWMASAVKRGFRYKRSFDIGILKMAETGLIDGLRDRWLNWKFSDVEDPPFQSIVMNQVELIFCVLVIGFFASIFILTIELLSFYCMKKFVANKKKMRKTQINVRPSKIYRTETISGD